MPEWPQTIPFDLKAAMEEASAQDWNQPLRTWAKRHSLKLQVQWFPELDRQMRGMNEWRWPPTVQDRWGAIKEWLEVNGVQAPSGLPAEPELNSGQLGH